MNTVFISVPLVVNEVSMREELIVRQPDFLNLKTLPQDEPAMMFSDLSDEMIVVTDTIDTLIANQIVPSQSDFDDKLILWPEFTTVGHDDPPVLCDIVCIDMT
jgi:hypothetical protein